MSAGAKGFFLSQIQNLIPQETRFWFCGKNVHLHSNQTEYFFFKYLNQAAMEEKKNQFSAELWWTYKVNEYH